MRENTSMADDFIAQVICRILKTHRGIIPLSQIRSRFFSFANADNQALTYRTIKRVVENRKNTFKIHTLENCGEEFGIQLVGDNSCNIVLQQNSRMHNAQISQFTKLYVRNTPKGFNVREEFSKIGSLEFCKICDENFAYVTFQSHDDALRAIREFEGKRIESKTLQVLFAPKSQQLHSLRMRQQKPAVETEIVTKNMQIDDIRQDFDYLPVKLKEPKDLFWDTNMLDEKQICMLDHCVRVFEYRANKFNF